MLVALHNRKYRKIFAVATNPVFSTRHSPRLETEEALGLEQNFFWAGLTPGTAMQDIWINLSPVLQLSRRLLFFHSYQEP